MSTAQPRAVDQIVVHERGGVHQLDRHGAHGVPGRAEDTWVATVAAGRSNYATALGAGPFLFAGGAAGAGKGPPALREDASAAGGVPVGPPARPGEASLVSAPASRPS